MLDQIKSCTPAESLRSSQKAAAEVTTAAGAAPAGKGATMAWNNIATLEAPGIVLTAQGWTSLMPADFT
jgi:hypothetical protein